MPKVPTHPAFEDTRISHLHRRHEKFAPGIPSVIFNGRRYNRRKSVAEIVVTMSPQPFQA
jgi:hypothetical protein